MIESNEMLRQMSKTVGSVGCFQIILIHGNAVILLVRLFGQNAC